jgi:hypothetical protein
MKTVTCLLPFAISMICLWAGQAHAFVRAGSADGENLSQARIVLESFGIDWTSEGHLVEGLRHEDDRARVATLRMLSLTGTISVLPEIWDRASDVSALVKNSLCHAIDMICQRDTGIGPVDYYLEQGEVEERGHQASRVLQAHDIGTTGSDVSLRGLADSNESVRIAALHFLERTGDVSHLDPIIRLIPKASEATRAAALHAISTISRSAAISMAREAYEDCDIDHVRVSIASLLARLGDPSEYRLVLEKASNPAAFEFAAAIVNIPDFAQYELLDNGTPIDWAVLLEQVIGNGELDSNSRRLALRSLNRIDPVRTHGLIRRILPHEKDAELAERMTIMASNFDYQEGLSEAARQQDVREREQSIEQLSAEEVNEGTASDNSEAESANLGSSERATRSLPPQSTHVPGRGSFAITWLLFLAAIPLLVIVGYIMHSR